MQDELEKYIDQNRDKFDLKTPPPFVVDRIVAELKSDNKKKPAGILISYRTIRWAAASLILVVCGIAFLTLRKQPADRTIVKTKVPVEAVKTPDEPSENKSAVAKSPDDLSENKGDVAKNKDEFSQNKSDATMTGSVKKGIDEIDEPAQNLASKKLVMFAGLHNMESPASRINAANAAEFLQNQGNDVVDALVRTLNSDPNSNVRLAALDGLARFHQENYVRRQLITCLRKQHDPVVQIAMIQLLTRMRESAILGVLDKMVKDENTQKAVKDCAYSSILLLRSS